MATPTVPSKKSLARNESLHQRAFVWTYLQQQFPDDQPLNILELNCGNGEDSLYLTKLGHQVIATDPSIHNLRKAQENADQWKFPERPTFRQLSLGSVHADRIEERFDLIFTNFGGLNTLSSQGLERLVTRFPRLLNPGARVVAVIMSKQCIWDWFATQNRERRKSRQKALKFHYHSPEEVRDIFSKRFHFIGQQPIGLALPPAAVEEQFKKRRKLIRRLKRWEKKLNQFAFLANLSDHYLIDFQLK
jgi:SAM-dependent methyltransferase